MGEVYQARDTRLDRGVAIKVLPETLSGDADFKRRFEREAKTISQLSHPNVCTLHDVGSHDGRDYLVMELLEGETLEDRLKRGALPLDELFSVGTEIAEALEAAHRRGLVHRDLKPGNVMLTSSGVRCWTSAWPKRWSHKDRRQTPRWPPATRTLTAEGSIVGTLHYMSPEQLEGKEADARSDIFALGVVLYEITCGERPFRGDSQAGVIATILQSRPEPLTAKKPLAPKRLEQVIDRCLAKDPERRWQSARDAALELEGVTSAEEVFHAPRQSWRRSHVAAAYLATLLAVLTVGWLVNARRPPGDAFSSTTWRTSTLDLESNANILVLSPDGERLLFGNSWEGLHLRDMRSGASVFLAATTARLSDWFGPSFDQDGKQIIYSDRERQLQRLALLEGAQPDPLGPGAGASQGDDGLLYYSTSYGGSGGSSQVENSGGGRSTTPESPDPRFSARLALLWWSRSCPQRKVRTLVPVPMMDRLGSPSGSWTLKARWFIP